MSTAPQNNNFPMSTAVINMKLTPQAVSEVGLDKLLFYAIGIAKVSQTE